MREPLVTHKLLSPNPDGTAERVPWPTSPWMSEKVNKNWGSFAFGTPPPPGTPPPGGMGPAFVCPTPARKTTEVASNSIARVMSHLPSSLEGVRVIGRITAIRQCCPEYVAGKHRFPGSISASISVLD